MPKVTTHARRPAIDICTIYLQKEFWVNVSYIPAPDFVIHVHNKPQWTTSIDRISIPVYYLNKFEQIRTASMSFSASSLAIFTSCSQKDRKKLYKPSQLSPPSLRLEAIHAYQAITIIRSSCRPALFDHLLSSLTKLTPAKPLSNAVTMNSYFAIVGLTGSYLRSTCELENTSRSTRWNALQCDFRTTISHDPSINSLMHGTSCTLHISSSSNLNVSLHSMFKTCTRVYCLGHGGLTRLPSSKEEAATT